MPPDFLLECSTCGAEAVWDTDAIPPVGRPEVGHPVLWVCARCAAERHHVIVDLFVMIDKLHHDICVVTELDRRTVDRVMAEMYRLRERAAEERPTGCLDPAEEVEEVADTVGIAPEMVEQISVAEADWMCRRGYLVEEGPALP